MASDADHFQRDVLHISADGDSHFSGRGIDDRIGQGLLLAALQCYNDLECLSHFWLIRTLPDLPLVVDLCKAALHLISFGQQVCNEPSESIPIEVLCDFYEAHVMILICN